jgi:hypothetical protein
VLEIPLLMVYMWVDHDVQPFRSYIDLSFHREALWPGLYDFLQAEPQYLVAIVHPSAVHVGVV